MSERREALKLVEVHGPTSIFIEVNVKEDGSVEVAGQDVGEGPSEMFGDSDYEYWLTVAPAQKDALVLALLEKLYKDDACMVSHLKELLDGKGVKYETFSYS